MTTEARAITPPLRIVDAIPTGARYDGRQVIDHAGQHVSLEQLVQLGNQRLAGEQPMRYGTDPTWPVE